MQCNAVMWRAAGGGGNYTGYQLVVRDVPVCEMYISRKVFSDYDCGILTQK